MEHGAISPQGGAGTHQWTHQLTRGVLGHRLGERKHVWVGSNEPRHERLPLRHAVRSMGVVLMFRRMPTASCWSVWMDHGAVMSPLLVRTPSSRTNDAKIDTRGRPLRRPHRAPCSPC